MAELSRIRRALPTSVLVLAMCTSLAGPSAAPAYQVKDTDTSNLDGKVAMSPAAERIETIEPDGGSQVGPGTVIKRPVILHNRTDKTVTFDMDVAQVVGSSAELVVDVRHGVREGAAAWVELEKTSFSLKSGQQGTMLITIRVPKDVKPGSKPFAVTATQRTQQTQTEGAGITPQFKQVAIFIVDLPGDAPIEGKLTDASITSTQKNLRAARRGKPVPENPRIYLSPSFADKHKLTLSSEYRNSGERLLLPRGRVVVRDIFGRIATTIDIPQFTVYPDGSNAQTIELKGLPTLGIFQARVELESDETGKQATTLPRFALIPKWFALAVGALLLYVLVRLVRWRLARRREWKQYLDSESQNEAASLDAADGEPALDDAPDDFEDQDWDDASEDA